MYAYFQQHFCLPLATAGELVKVCTRVAMVGKEGKLKIFDKANFAQVLDYVAVMCQLGSMAITKGSGGVVPAATSGGGGGGSSSSSGSAS